jgi:hypothetical protein
MNHELEKDVKEVIMAYIKVVPLHLPGRTMRNPVTIPGFWLKI